MKCKQRLEFKLNVPATESRWVLSAEKHKAAVLTEKTQFSHGCLYQGMPMNLKLKLAEVQQADRC